MQPYDGLVTADEFATSRNLFELLIADLRDPAASESSHAELEELCWQRGRQVLRQLLQDHLDLRAMREEQHLVANRPEGCLEKGHHRLLATVVGTVTVRRCAIRSPGRPNRYPADDQLALPTERHSHGLRKLAVVEAVRGSFDAAHAAITSRCGNVIGKRQIEDQVVAAVDIDAFYSARIPSPRTADELLIISADGKGVVMRPEALRPATRKAAAAHRGLFRTRLASGEKPHRKRMATLAVVHDAVPAPRRPHDVISIGKRRGDRPKRAGPCATGKWVYGSVIEPANAVIGAAFDQAQARDPGHARTWVVLVDGDPHQIPLLQAEAARRSVAIDIVCDLVHVLEYCWRAARCLHDADDPKAEQQVAGWALRLLAGNTDQVITDLRTRAVALPLNQRGGLDSAVGYLSRHLEFLHYDQALEAGWPIAAGVVEGTARHLVGDRLEITGARWGLAGAEAILKLRAVISNGDLNDYWHYHRAHEYERLHAHRTQPIRRFAKPMRPSLPSLPMQTGPRRWKETLAFLQQARFDDLLLPGGVERDHAIPIVRPWFFDAYLVADLGYLHLRLSDDHGSLQLTVTPEIVPDQDWLDDDEELVLTSVESQLLGGFHEARCTALRYWTNSESDLEQGLIRCLELSFPGVGHLVFDAMQIDGIRIGTNGAAELLLDPQAGSPLTEHRWTRHQAD